MLNTNQYQIQKSNSIASLPFHQNQNQVNFNKFPNQSLILKNFQQNNQQNLMFQSQKLPQTEQNQGYPLFQFLWNDPAQKGSQLFKNQPFKPIQSQSSICNRNPQFGNSFSNHQNSAFSQCNNKQPVSLSKVQSMNILQTYNVPEISQTQKILPIQNQIQQDFSIKNQQNKVQPKWQSAIVPSQKTISNQTNVQNFDPSLLQRTYQQNNKIKIIKIEKIESIKEEQYLDEDVDVMKTQIVICYNCQQSSKLNTIILNCHHFFHQECIEEHLKRQINQKQMPVCLCKKRIPYKQIQQIMQKKYYEIICQLDRIIFDNLTLQMKNKKI